MSSSHPWTSAITVASSHISWAAPNTSGAEDPGTHNAAGGTAVTPGPTNGLTILVI